MDLALLQIGDRGVCGLSATARSGSVSIRRAFADALPAAFESLTPADRAPALLEVFKRNGFDERRVVLVIPRRFVIFRQFSVPAGSGDEVASMVRFQLEKELPVPVDRIKYAAFEMQADARTVRVVAASVPVDVIESATAALAELGVRVSAVVLGTLGLAVLAPTESGPVAVEHLSDDSLEVLVWEPGKRLESQSASVEGLDPAGVADQVRRMVMGYSERSDDPIRTLKVSQPLKGLDEKLAGSVSVEPLSLASVLSGDERVPPPATIPLIGAALGLASRSPWMKDLLAPPVPKRRSPTVTLARAVALAVVALVGVTIWIRVDASDIRGDVERMNAEIAELKWVDKKLKELREQTVEAAAWAESRPRWIDALSDLNALVDTKKVFLESASFDGMGSTTLVGRALSQADASDLVQQLNGSSRFTGAILAVAEEAPRPSRKQSKGNDPEEPYRISFTIRAKVRVGEPIQ